VEPWDVEQAPNELQIGASLESVYLVYAHFVGVLVVAEGSLSGMNAASLLSEQELNHN